MGFDIVTSGSQGVRTGSTATIAHVATSLLTGAKGIEGRDRPVATRLAATDRTFGRRPAGRLLLRGSRIFPGAPVIGTGDLVPGPRADHESHVTGNAPLAMIGIPHLPRPILTPPC